MDHKYGCSNNSTSFIAQQYEIEVLIGASGTFILLSGVGSFISESTDRISCELFLHISYDRLGSRKWMYLSIGRVKSKVSVHYLMREK